MSAPGLDDVFERVIEQALAELPAPFHEHLENVEVLVEDEHWDEPDLYGLYDGVPLPERLTGSTDFQQPDRVYVFRTPLLADFGGDPERLAHEIRVTVLHEIGHFFGLDEARLEALGWA